MRRKSIYFLQFFSKLWSLVNVCIISINAFSVRQCTNSAPSMNTESTEVKLSDNCVQQLKGLKFDSGNNFLRVSVDGGGCSGFQYKFGVDDVINDDDRIFARDGVKVVIDTISLEYVKGSTIDYHQELIRSAFRIINNPIAEHGCSCGVSFSIKL